MKAITNYLCTALMVLGMFTIAKIYLIPQAETEIMKYTLMFVSGMLIAAMIMKDGKGKR